MSDGLLGALGDLVLPRECVGCGRAGHALCPECALPAPVTVQLPGLVVHAGGPYGAALRSALLAYKERGRRDLVRPLAGLLAGAVRAVPGSGDHGVLLMPAPSSPAAARERAGDHMRRLARATARRTGLPAARALRLARAVRDSAGLGVAERAVNLDLAMRAAAPPSGYGRAVLVDDIVTSGATLREGARALRAAGWTVLGAAVVAATPRRANMPRIAGTAATGRLALC